MKRRTKGRVFGNRINFKSLACAPVNELGVVYLFGVLHDTFDLKIESIQSGFPDCIARRRIGSDRWEEVRIEFEYNSRSFVNHKHDPDRVNTIVCWNHNWNDCPAHIEVIELSSLLKDVTSINEEIKVKKKLTEYHQFCSEKRKEGFGFSEIAKMWQKRKMDKTKKNGFQKKSKENLTEYQKFCSQKRKEGLNFTEIAELWKAQKKAK
jgi:hypothetical protein